MTIITLSQKVPGEVYTRNIEINEGELIAVVGRKVQYSDLKTVHIGNFTGYQESTRHNCRRIGNDAKIIISPALHLSPSKSFMGVDLPIIEYFQSRNISVNGLGDIIIGKKNIVDYLKLRAGYEPHAELIERLWENMDGLR
jgi:hypothetical protein